jgi:hypothetical protein
LSILPTSVTGFFPAAASRLMGWHGVIRPFTRLPPRPDRRRRPPPTFR